MHTYTAAAKTANFSENSKSRSLLTSTRVYHFDLLARNMQIDRQNKKQILIFQDTEMKSIFFAGLIASATPTIAQNVPYQSEEFRNGNSRIPVIFACMFAGHQSGLDVGATETAMDFMLATGITPQRVDTWAHDATIFVSQELAQTDWAEFWRDSCEVPFKKMRETFSE